MTFTNLSRINNFYIVHIISETKIISEADNHENKTEQRQYTDDYWPISLVDTDEIKY